MSLSATNGKSDLTSKTINGIFWSYLSFIVGKGLSFLSTIILARLLLPEQFGVMGYCLIFIQYLDIINSAGIDGALISCRENLQEAANAAFIGNIALGCLTFVITWMAAPSVANFFNEPEVIPALRVLALSLPISGLGLVPDALIQRGLRFKTKLFPDISRNLSKGLVSILLALLGFGVWSLIWGQIISALTGSLLCWLLAGWKPTWRFNREAIRSIMAFGFNIILLEFAGAFRDNVDYLLVGRILGAAALGYYTMAFRIPELLISSLNSVIGRVSFPALAAMQVEKEKMRSFYYSYIRYLSVFVFPVGIGLALTAPVFIPTFLSSQWDSAIVPTSLIAVALAISAIGYVPGVLYKAIGRPEILNLLGLIKIPIAVAVLWYSTRWGIIGVAAGHIFVGMFSVALDTLVANWIMQYQLRHLITAILPGLGSSIVMGLSLVALNKLFTMNGLWGLLIMVMVGISVYFVTLLLTGRSTVIQGLVVLRQIMARPEKVA